jgi:hypothetical protein
MDLVDTPSTSPAGLPRASAAQQRVLESLEANNNVVIDSVAGSGKTTTNLHIAQRFPSRSILLLTYNAKLKLETRARTVKSGLLNLQVQTYHSFFVRNYANDCFTDTGIRRVLAKGVAAIPAKPFFFDLVILDEAQDISPLYYEAVCKLLRDNGCNEAQIVVMGDRAQSIFDFNGADERFIVFAERLFSFCERRWTRCLLAQSFRVTHEMATFLNECALGGETRVLSDKVSGVLPRYKIFSFPIGMVRVLEEFERLYVELGYAPGDIFILAPSVRAPQVKTKIETDPDGAQTLKTTQSFSPVTQLENMIKEKYHNTVPVFVPGSDDTELDESVMKDKVVFSSFHQAKGLERKAVIVMGFDASYFQFFKKNADPKICPNEIYVALTRGSEQLTVMHNRSNDFLPFLDKDKLSKYCDMDTMSLLKQPSYQLMDIKTMSPTDLLRHLPSDLVDECYDCLDVERLRPAGETIEIEGKTRQQYTETTEGFELVSDLTGIAIPALYELEETGEIQLLGRMQLRHEVEESGNQLCKENKKVDHYEYDNNLRCIEAELAGLRRDFESPEPLLRLANMWNRFSTGLLYKLMQITRYDWVSKEQLAMCMARMRGLGLSPCAQLEVRYTVGCAQEQILGTTRGRAGLAELHDRCGMAGFADCVDGDRLFEFKCVKLLSKEHFLQLALYAYMREKMPISVDLAHRLSDLDMRINVDKHKLSKLSKGCEQSEVLKHRLARKMDARHTSDRLARDEGSSGFHRRYFMYNILTDEMFEVRCALETLVSIVDRLVVHKYLTRRMCTDEEFLVSAGVFRSRQCLEFHEKIE